MNARLLILAILTAVILALYMTVSAPATEGEPDIRATLGGDCSADRATGDLYHPADPYCLVAEGPAGGSMAPNGPGAGYDRKQDNNSPSIPAIVPDTGPGPDDPVIQVVIFVDPPVVEPGDPPSPGIDEPGKDKDDPRRNDPPNKEIKRQPKDDPKDRKADEPKDKQCKKDGRDNVNSQGNHDCSADHPDPHSGQERTTDHGQGNGSNDQVPGNDHGNKKGKKD
jgi:hypothetical protein